MTQGEGPMRIVIEIDGNKVTAVGTERAAQEAAGLPGFDATDAAPPPALLERAKKLGAMNAGGARFGIGAALAATAAAGETPKVASAPPRRRRATKRRRR